MENQSVVHRPTRDALTVMTCAEVPQVQRHIIGSTKEMDDSAINYQTPRGGIPATVSMDEQDIENSTIVDDETTGSTDDRHVDTARPKADLLSRTIRSAAIGQLTTPELIRASDEILRRAKGTEGVPSTASSSTTTPETSTPLLLQRANRILNHPQHAATYGDLSVGSSSTPSSKTMPELSTPLLLQRANKILNYPQHAASRGDLSVDTFCKVTSDTEPICNYQQSTSSSLLLSRPPRPPAPLRTPSGATTTPVLDVTTVATSTSNQPITPSPKSAIQQQHLHQQLFPTQSETMDEDHVVMERVINTLQQVATSKPPPPYSPLINQIQTVALKTMDLDDHASVGSESVRSVITTATSKSTAQTRDLSISATAAVPLRGFRKNKVTIRSLGVGLMPECPGGSPTMDSKSVVLSPYQSCSNELKPASVLPVAESEDIAKDVTTSLEETPSPPHSTSLVDNYTLPKSTDCTGESPTMDTKSMVLSPLQSSSNQPKPTSALPVAESEDVAKEGTTSLEETPSPPHSTSLVDDHTLPKSADCTGNSPTMETKSMVLPPLQSCPKQSNPTSVLPVAEIEDVAKEVVETLDETLSQSHASSLVDDHTLPKSTYCTGESLALDTNAMVSPPLQSFSNQSNPTIYIPVAETEDVPKEVAETLEETLSQSHATSLVDDHTVPKSTDCTGESLTVDTNAMVSPPLQSCSNQSRPTSVLPVAESDDIAKLEPMLPQSHASCLLNDYTLPKSTGSTSESPTMDTESMVLPPPQSCSNQSNPTSVLPVAESDDIAKDVTISLEETPSPSHSISLVDDHKLPKGTDCTSDGSTMDINTMVSPPFGSRQQAMRSSPTVTTTDCCCVVL